MGLVHNERRLSTYRNILHRDDGDYNIFWNPHVHISYQISYSTANITLSILTPVPVLLYSVFTPRKNILIGLIFALSTFLPIIQILRLVAIKNQHSPIDTYTFLTWSILETNLGIITVSLLSLSPLCKTFLSSEIDTFRLSLKIDHAKMKIRELGQESPAWQRVVMFMGYGEMKKAERERERAESQMESRSGSRLDGGWGDWGGSEDGNWEMGIIKTTEVIVSREGSTWEYEPKSTWSNKSTCTGEYEPGLISLTASWRRWSL